MLENIFELFENLQEIVYISDADDRSLIYMNKYALNIYGFSSNDEIIGKKCYEVFQGADTPCASCRCHTLEPGQYNEWQYHSNVLNRLLSKKDTIIEQDGRRYQLGMAFDMTAQEQTENVLQSMRITEAMINEALSEALREENPSAAINVFIRSLGQKTQSERVYIFEQSGDDYVSNTFEWCTDGVTPQIDNLQNVPMSVVSTWYNYFEQNRNIIITNVEDIKHTDPMVYEYLEPQDIHSLVVSPLIMEGRIIGFYGTDNPPAGIMAHIKEMAWIVGHFIVSLLKKRNIISHLAEMSYFEQLTGMQNRRAMDVYIEQNQTAEHFGVIYCDVMGLKKVNDTQGHQAGDALLLRATECLKKHFSRTELYRIGGDEFLVLCKDIDAGDFNARIETLRVDMVKNDAMMALGHIWSEYTDDIEKLVIEADQLMYAEKQAYYAAAAKAGLLRRRRDDKKSRK